MSFKMLLESWRGSAAAPRTAKAYSVRLPVDEAAQLEALADMFPGRAPEQLISELLGTALKEVAAAMPYVAGARIISTDEQGDPVYEDVGPTPRFMELARSHRRELEAALQPSAARAAPTQPPAAASPARTSRAKPAARRKPRPAVRRKSRPRA